MQFNNKMGVTELVFELYALKAKIKGVFSRSYCSYGNLLCQENNTTSDWAVFDTKIVASIDKEW